MPKDKFWSSPLAALILLAIALLFLWTLFYWQRTSLLPSSRSRPGSDSVTLLEPLDAVSPPVRFRWAAGGEQRFRIEVFDSSGRIIWQKETRAADATLPEDVRRQMVSDLNYSWKVQQLDSNGAVTAESLPRSLIVH